VTRLCRDLRRYDIDYWFDREKIEPADDWQDAIKKAIEEGGFFIACFSREYTGRDRNYMNEELTLAIEELRKRPTDRAWFIPVLLTEGASIPNREIGGGKTLRNLQSADLSKDWRGEMRRIVKVIHKIKPKDIDKKRTQGGLRDGERDLLQILLEDEDFSLSRSDKGAVLKVDFGINTKKITHRDEKDAIKLAIPDFVFVANRLQKQLDNLLIEKKKLELPNKEKGWKDFKFRYASGGVLPIVHFRGQDYYCLFYRDVYPIGWNIANGSTNTLAELLNPLETANRELCEELWIVNPEKKLRYVFADDFGKLPDRPEFAVARQIWKEFFSRLGFPNFFDFPNFKEAEIRLTWEDGPDELRISTELGEPRTISPCYLNINALDFGIEVDRIARLDINEDDKLCDGEIIDGRLLNRVIGLFDVEEMNQMVRSKKKKKSFLPQKVFYSAADRSLEPLEQVIGEFITHVRDTGIRSEEKLADFEKTKMKPEVRYNLCPVTHGVIRRYAS
jgi:hypothetical protein